MVTDVLPLALAVYTTHLVEFMDPTLKTIHALGPDQCAYHVTLGNSLEVNVDADELKAAAYLLKATIHKPLKLCIVVPMSKFRAWADGPGTISLPQAAAVDTKAVRVFLIGVSKATLSSASR